VIIIHHYEVIYHPSLLITHTHTETESGCELGYCG